MSHSHAWNPLEVKCSERFDRKKKKNNISDAGPSFGNVNDYKFLPTFVQNKNAFMFMVFIDFFYNC